MAINENVSATETEINDPINATEAREQADAAQAAAAEAKTAAEAAQEKLETDMPSLEKAKDTASDNLKDAQDELDSATAAREDAQAARDEAQNDADAAKAAADTARDELGDTVAKANDLIEDANNAAATLIKSIDERNELQSAVNEAIEAVITATDNGEPAVNISSLRDVVADAQSLLDAFDARHDLETMEQLRINTDTAAQAAIYEVEIAQKTFDNAMDAVQDAINVLNKMESEYFHSQVNEHAATLNVNDAISALNDALEALHNAELDVAQAIAYAEHLQAVADVKEANADAWDQYDTDMAGYETAYAKYESDRAEWLNGYDPTSQEYLDALAAWEAKMEVRGIALDKYVEAKAAYEAAQKDHNEAVDAYNAKEAAYEEALKEWQDFMDNLGTDGPNTVVRVDGIKQPLAEMGSSLNGNFSEEIAPGVTLYRNNSNNTFGLSVSEDAQQGTIVLQLKNGNTYSHFTISINQAGEYTNFDLKVSQSESSGFGIVGKTFMGMPVFGENPPSFDEIAPNAPDQGEPPEPPQVRGEEPGAPDKPDLVLKDVPGFQFSFDPFNGEDGLTPPEIAGNEIQHTWFRPPVRSAIDDLLDLLGKEIPEIKAAEGELPEFGGDDDGGDDGDGGGDGGDEPIDDPDVTTVLPLAVEDEIVTEEPTPDIEVIAAPPAAVPVAVTAEVMEIDIDDFIVPLARTPDADEYQATIVIEDSLVPLAQPAVGEVAGFITTGIILASLIAAVVGNSIRKMRTVETE